MAGVREEALHGVGPWPLGVVNLTKEGAVPAGENGRALGVREADNVDFDTAGVPSRRAGSAPFFAGTLSHSLFRDERFPFGLFVDAGELCAIDVDGTVSSLGVSIGHGELSYAAFNDRIFFSNRTRSGMVDMALQCNAWGPECPAGQPTLAPEAGYGLPPGQYQVAVTFVDALGRESGSTLAAATELSTPGGIALTSIPQPTGGARIAVYVTDANDQVLRLHSTLEAGVTELVIGQAAQGRKLETQHLTPMPPGQVVALWNGRQLVADGHYLRWSPPLRYGLTDRARNVIRFAAPIDLIAPVAQGAAAGVYVAAGSRTEFFSGADPADWSRHVRKSSGAVPGSLCWIPGDALGLEGSDPVACWYARDGQFCIGQAGGAIATPKNGLTAIESASRAAVLYRESPGMQQFVAALRGARPQGLAVRDRAVAHVIYDGRSAP